MEAHGSPIGKLAHDLADAPAAYETFQHKQDGAFKVLDKPVTQSAPSALQDDVGSADVPGSLQSPTMLGRELLGQERITGETSR